MPPRRRCPTCGSRQWHKEPSSGLIACSEGHVLQNYRNETTEITEVGPHAMKKRTLKNRKKMGESSKADPKLYHGARGRYHYFLCLQLILRKQIAALVQLWDLPPEFETVCRDLWALHLSLLPDPPPGEPYHGGSEDVGTVRGDPEEAEKPGGSPSLESERFSSRLDSDQEAGTGDECDRNAGEQEKKQITNDEEGEGEEEDSELEALMRENSELSSSSDETERQDKPLRKGKRKGRPVQEGAVSTIAVLVLGCWTLRIPVMYRDFARIIERYELPYLDGLGTLAESVVQHLTKNNVQALSPPHAPGTRRVHSVTSRLAKNLYKKYGIFTPEVNAGPILWRITKEMGGTPTLYRLSKRVASAVSVPLTMHWSLAPALEQRKTGDAHRHVYDNAAPEVALVGCVMIVLKMMYGLDGKERVPKDEEEVLCGLPCMNAYLTRMEAMNEAVHDRFSSAREIHVGDMREEELEEYIGFCEGILPRVGEGYSGIVGGRRKEMNTVRDMELGGGTRVMEEGMRAGEEYKIWHARDIDGAMAEDWEKVVQRGACLVGVTTHYLGGVVQQLERRLK